MLALDEIKVHSEEVQEILGRIPHWIVRWGVIIILILLSGILIGSYLLKYPDIISAPMKLTTVNPPAPLVSKVSGKIEKLFVKDGELVEPGSRIALLKSTANYHDVILFKEFLQQLEKDWVLNNCQFEIVAPKNLVLGELQTGYIQLCKIIFQVNNYLNQDYIKRKIELIHKQIENSEEYYKQIVKQRQIKEIEFELIKSNFSQDSIFYHKGGYGITKSEFDRITQEFLQQKANYIGFIASINNTKATIIQLRQTLLELHNQRSNDLNQFYIDLEEEIQVNLNHILDWEDRFLLTSPISGKVTFTKYWSTNQVVAPDERLATVVPIEETKIIGKTFISSSGFGKVEVGQKVNIKLAGFPQSEFGVLQGKIKTISLVPEEQGYAADIELNGGMISTYSEQLKFIQEMDGTADIITNDMRLIYRLFNPLKMLMNI